VVRRVPRSYYAIGALLERGTFVRPAHAVQTGASPLIAASRIGKTYSTASGEKILAL